MKWRRVVIAAVLLAVPMWAWAQQMGTEGRRVNGPNSSASGAAQPVIMGGIVRADTTFKAFTFDADGHLLTAETTPAYQDFRDGTTAIIDDTTAIGMADSSVVINMGKYRASALAIRVAGAPANVVIAVQIRTHIAAASDSASIFPWYVRRTDGVAADTSAHYQNTNAPGAITHGRTEFMVLLKSDATVVSKWGNQAHAYIMLSNRYGEVAWTPYLSVRYRVLTGSPGHFKVYLMGTPQ